MSHIVNGDDVCIAVLDSRCLPGPRFVSNRVPSNRGFSIIALTSNWNWY